ncbi:outer membrane beta-barrel family protein [Porphyromonadaceae bacterium W3.11]|nr:outer membrane beta-barrel family protein [Porphyromonadaceae bacterium W3.11]
MQKFNLFCLLFIATAMGYIFVPNLSAQETNNKVVVTGSIVDDTDAEVPFAKVKIKPSLGDGSQYFVQVSDNLGAFRIALPAAGKYDISVSMIGMDELNMSFVVPKEKSNYSLGKLKLKESATMLENVTVTATKKLVTVEVDKISYSINEDPESKSSDLLKMLRKVPLVTVDGQGNIQVNGSSKFIIYRNGKPDKMTSSNPKEVLKSIPASSIKSIEVITDPGVKFDAEGSSAILNIITDKNTSLAGVAGTASVSIGSYGNFNGGLYLNAKVGKLGLTGNILHGRFGGRPTESSTTTYIGNNHILNDGESENKGYYNMFNATITYEIDSLNLFSLSTNGMPYRATMDNNTIEQKWIDDVLVEKNKNQTHSSYNRGSYSMNVDYQHSTKRAGELLTFSYMFDRSPNSSESNVIRNVLDLSTDEVLPNTFGEQLSKTNSSMNEHTAQIDYTRPFKWHYTHNLEAGIKYIARRSESTPEYLIRNTPDGTFTPGSLFGQHLNSSDLDYGQDIYALYIAWRTNWSQKLSTKVGTRVEKSTLDVKYKDLKDANFTKSELDFVPQVRLSYNITPFDQTSLNYNFRIQRPGISQLNPYRDQTSEFWVSYGNPDLKAQRNHNIGLTYGHFSSKFTINTSFNFTFSNNAILSYSKQDASLPGVIQHTYGNLGKRRGLSANAFINYTPWTWLRLYMNISGSNNNLSSNTLDETKDWSTFIGYTGGTFTLPKSWDLSFSLGGYKFGSYQMINDFSYFTSISVGKSLFNDKLSLSLDIMEPFRDTITRKMHTYGEGFETHSINKNPGSRMFNFSIRYRFGELKERIKSVSRTINNTDLMEAEKNQGNAPANTPM